MSDIYTCDSKSIEIINGGIRQQYKKQEFQICEGMSFEYWAKNEWHFCYCGKNAHENDRLEALALMLTKQFYDGIPKKNLLMVIAYFRQVCCKAA